MDAARPAQRTDVGLAAARICRPAASASSATAREWPCVNGMRMSIMSAMARNASSQAASSSVTGGSGSSARIVSRSTVAPIPSISGRHVGRDQTRKIRLVGAVGAAGDDVRHGLGTNGIAQRDDILRQRDQAYRGQDLIATQPARQALAVPAFIDLAEVTPDLFGQAEPLADPLSDLAMRREDRPNDRGRLGEPRFDRLLLRHWLEVVVEPLESLDEDPSQLRAIAHVEPDEVLAQCNLVTEETRQEIGVGVAADVAQHRLMVGVAPVLLGKSRKVGNPHREHTGSEGEVAGVAGGKV